LTMKILYILGGSRTGSTVVDNILNEVDGFFSGGEIRFLWERLLEGRLCGCRRRFEDCPVWSDALGSGFGFPDSSRIDVEEVAAWQRDSLKLVRTFQVLHDTDGRMLRSRSLRNFADVSRRLYRALFDATGARVLVDSSKRASNAAMLGMLTDFAPYFLHLVRDPRAVAYSRQRRKLNPDRPVPGFMDVSSVSNSAASWLAWNVTSEAVARRHDPNHVMRLRYEDFAADPLGTTARIVRLVDEVAPDLPFIDPTTVRLKGNHTVSGNPARYVDGVVPIREDDEWRSQMPIHQRLAVTLMTFPLLVKYGYGLDGAIRGPRDQLTAKSWPRGSDRSQS
jgi:Sulfotransferase family